MRTRISSPEPGHPDPETQRAWEACKTLSELAWPAMPESHFQEVFWSMWEQTTRVDSRRALFRYMGLWFYDLNLSRDQYPKWHIVNVWMRETREILDIEEARNR